MMINQGELEMGNEELLLTEVEELRHEIKEVTHMNTLNRSVIQMLSETKCGDNKLFYKVIVSLLEQIDMQEAKIKKLIIERNQILKKSLLNEKIANDLFSVEKANQGIYREELQQLKAEINMKNNRLREYQEKIGEVDYLIGFATKTVNIFDPSEQTLRFNQEILNLNKLILVQQQANNKLSKENEGLIKINLALKSQLERAKSGVHKINEYSDILGDNLEESKIHSHRVMNTSVGETQKSILRRQDTSFAFLRFQKTLVDEQMDSDFDPDNLCPELSVLFPDKVEKINKKRNLPTLPFGRVRELMRKNAKKMDKELKTNVVHVNPTQKIIELESELQEARRQLSKYILREKQLTTLKERYERFIQELQGRNGLLIQSNDKLQQNWRKISKQFAFCQEVVGVCQQIINSDIDRPSSEQIQEKLKDSLDTLNGVQLHKQKDVARVLGVVRALSSRDADACQRPRSKEI